jgi:hypothetical protein
MKEVFGLWKGSGLGKQRSWDESDQLDEYRRGESL